jgi:mono/diheme cytochrome c family protein
VGRNAVHRHPLQPGETVRLVAVVAALACGTALPLAHDRITTKVTWDGEISRIVEARCVSCHTPGGRGPMPLTTYDEARPWAKAIRDEVVARRMPKWHAARGYGDFANDPSLSPFEIALIAAWADGGAPRTLPGRPEGAAPASPPARPAAHIEPTGTRAVDVPCGDHPVADHDVRLVAVHPRGARGSSIAVAATLPDGRREIVGWFRDYDPGFPTTYWLRTPLDLPRGSRMQSETTGGSCTVSVTIAAR